MPLVKDIHIKKKNDYSVLIGDTTILNTELKKFYMEYKKAPNWDALSDFEKAKILAYIFIIAGKYDSFTITEEFLKKYEKKQLKKESNFEEYIKKSIVHKNKIVEEIINELKELDLLYAENEEAFKKLLTEQEARRLEQIKKALSVQFGS